MGHRGGIAELAAYVFCKGVGGVGPVRLDMSDFPDHGVDPILRQFKLYTDLVFRGAMLYNDSSDQMPPLRDMLPGTLPFLAERMKQAFSIELAVSLLPAGPNPDAPLPYYCNIIDHTFRLTHLRLGADITMRYVHG